MAVAWIAVVVILVITAMLLLTPTASKDLRKLHERARTRARRLKIYLWLVALFVVATVIAQLEVPVMDIVTGPSEDFYKAALWPVVVVIALFVFGRAMIRILRDSSVKSISVGSSGVSMEFTTDDIRRTLD